MKCSYKDNEIQSSVVVLADGRAMEVRRGEKTTFAKGERKEWSSLDDWIETLPPGARIKVSGLKGEGEGKRRGRKRKEITNPVLARFLERVRAFLKEDAPWRSIKIATLSYEGTRGQLLQRRIEGMQGILDDTPGLWSKYIIDDVREGMAVAVREMEVMTASGEAGLPVFRPSASSHYITLTSDGQLFPVCYDRERDMIGYFVRGPVLSAGSHAIYLGPTFVPLTDPEMPLWESRCGGFRRI